MAQKGKYLKKVIFMKLHKYLRNLAEKLVPQKLLFEKIH